MKRKTNFLLDRAINSLILSIEIFNRPYEKGRIEGIILFLDHAFEMLLKGVIFERTGKLKKRDEKYNYGFDKCIQICRDTFKIIDSDESLILLNLNSFRDAAVHDVLIISEGMLYSHSQSAVQIFGSILKKEFNTELTDFLPVRILPISTSIPQDMQVLISTDLDGIRGLLSGRQRREDEAEARLRPYELIERNLSSLHGDTVRFPSTQRLLNNIKTRDWRTVLPMVSGLVQPTITGIPISIHVTKQKGIPVRIDPNAPTAIAFRYIKPEDKYPYLTCELAEKLGINLNKTVGFAKLFEMRGNLEFHTRIKIGHKSYSSRYSEKAFNVLKTSIQKEGADKLWEEYKKGVKKNPVDYL